MAGVGGRAELEDRLAQAWTRARDGAGRIVVLLGDPGIGKSTALTRLGQHIGGAARIVSCRGGELASPMAVATEIAAVLPAPPSAGTVTAEVDPLRAADVLGAGLAEARSTALLVDDIHDADPSSRTALNLALRRGVAGGALIVITGRKMPAVLSFAEGFEVEEITGLDRAGAAGLLDAASSVPIAPAVRDHLLEVADGNPLVLSHLPGALSAEQLRGEQLLPEAIPLVGDLRTVFTRQLPPPGSAARELLEVAAVSADGSWALLAALRPGIAETALEDLESRGLASLGGGRLTLRHPLLRSAAISAMSPARWRRLNLELAGVESLPEEVRLAHRARGTVGPDEEVVDSLVEAARLMRVRGGADAAARLLDRAVDLTGSDTRRQQLRLEAAHLLGVAGESAAARHRLEALLADPASGDLRVAATLTLGTLEALDGAPAAAWQRLTECLAVATPAEVGVVHARMAIPLGMLGLVAQITQHAETAVGHCKPHSPEWDVARVIHAHAACAEDEGRANDLVDEMLDGLDLFAAVQHDPMVGLHIGRALAVAERCEVAMTALTELVGRLRGEGARSSLAMAFGALGETHIRASRFDEALVCLDEAIALSLATGQRAFAPFWLALRARVRAIRGDDASASADLDLGFAISDEQSTFGARYFLLANAGLVALTGQRHRDAAGHLAEVWAFEQTGGLLAPQLARWHADLVEAYVETGCPDEAAPLLAHLRRVVSRPGASRWTRATALRAEAVVAGGTDPGRAAGLLDRAAEIYHPELDAFDRARTHLLKARLTDGEVAEQARREALYGFRRTGAAAWAVMVAATDDQAESGIDAVTDAEQRILVEVAKGLTNQQIAKRLDISVKTVANHLYRAYRKLGVASRTEAARHVLLDGAR